MVATIMGGVLAVAMPAAVMAQTPPATYGYGPRMMWDGGGYGMMFGPLFMILALVAATATVVVLVRWLGGPTYGPPHHHALPPARTPLDILRERFARGEIEKAEFEERRRILGD
jgi:putative membrane protein